MTIHEFDKLTYGQTDVDRKTVRINSQLHGKITALTSSNTHTHEKPY